MGVWIDDCPILDEQPYSHFFYQLVPVVFVTRGRHYWDSRSTYASALAAEPGIQNR